MDTLTLIFFSTLSFMHFYLRTQVCKDTTLLKRMQHDVMNAETVNYFELKIDI